MSASATVQIHAPLVHQEPIYESAAPRKLLRWGRRTGKTRLAFTAAIAGHGPEMPEREGGRMFPGLIAGYDVAWLAPDYKQAGVIWNEEIEPRFRGVAGVRVNSSEHTVTLAGAGTLYVATAENLDAIRGKGARVIGVIIDEAAHLDLQRALQSIVFPVLLDNAPRGSWLILSSTTNSGHDGNQAQRTPSWFNTLCEQCEQGLRDTNRWAHSYAIGTDNPVIDPDAFQELVAEYDAEAIQLDEEVYAKLLAPGAGLAFPEWRIRHHTTRFLPERDQDVEWRWFAGGDWGYASPGALTLLAAGPDRSVIARYCYKFNGSEAKAGRSVTPYEAGVTFAKRCEALGALPEWLALDPASWSVTDGGPSIAEELQRGITEALQARAFPVIQPPRGPGSRVAGKLLVHEALRWKAPEGHPEDEPLPAWLAPRLRFNPDDASYLVETIPVLPRDQKNPEDVDTDADDHGYDSLRYGLMARVPQHTATAHEQDDAHRHPGFERRPALAPGAPPEYARRHRPTFGDAIDADDEALAGRRTHRWRRTAGGLTYEEDD